MGVETIKDGPGEQGATMPVGVQYYRRKDDFLSHL